MVHLLHRLYGVDAPEETHLPQHTKFCKDQSNRCGDIAIVVIFTMAAAAFLGFLNIRNFNGLCAVRGQYALPCQIS